MLPDSHYDKDKADRAVAFIENLCHTKGKWAGQPFLLLPWQEQIVRDLFGIVKENGKRQFLTAYIEIPKSKGSQSWQQLSLFTCCMLTMSQAPKYTALLVTATRRPSSLMSPDRWSR